MRLSVAAGLNFPRGKCSISDSNSVLVIGVVFSACLSLWTVLQRLLPLHNDASNQKSKRANNSARLTSYVLQGTLQQRPESCTITITWHARKNRVDCKKKKKRMSRKRCFPVQYNIGGLSAKLTISFAEKKR